MQPYKLDDKTEKAKLDAKLMQASVDTNFANIDSVFIW